MTNEQWMKSSNPANRGSEATSSAYRGLETGQRNYEASKAQSENRAMTGQNRAITADDIANSVIPFGTMVFYRGILQNWTIDGFRQVNTTQQNTICANLDINHQLCSASFNFTDGLTNRERTYMSTIQSSWVTYSGLQNFAVTMGTGANQVRLVFNKLLFSSNTRISNSANLATNRFNRLIALIHNQLNNGTIQPSNVNNDFFIRAFNIVPGQNGSLSRSFEVTILPSGFGSEFDSVVPRFNCPIWTDPRNPNQRCP